MNTTNKAIADRIKEELRIRDWSRTDLLKRIIKYKNPEIMDSELYIEANKRKGNFSTTLNGKGDRSFSLEDLYIISKVLSVPFEYTWFGEKLKEDFKPRGADYVAFQDNETEYRTYIAGLESEECLALHDEFGFNFFDYLAQYRSINGYRFLEKYFNLHFDYSYYNQLAFIKSNGHPEYLSSKNENFNLSDNLIMVLNEAKDFKTFKRVYFDNCSLERFSARNVDFKKTHFSDYFLNTLLNNDRFYKSILKINKFDLSEYDNLYEKGTSCLYVEPMFYDALSFALKHEREFRDRLFEMLDFALEFSKQQFEFVKEHLNEHYGKDEHGDFSVRVYGPRTLSSSRGALFGNFISINETVEDDSLNKIIKEVNKYTFNMFHIVNKQEKENDLIKISTPNNDLFMELLSNSAKQQIGFLPSVAYSDKEFTYFQSYESRQIRFDNLEELKFTIECLNKSQGLVVQKHDKCLVHGNLNDKVLIIKNGKLIGLSGWQNCYYGSKYEDRAELLSSLNLIYIRDDIVTLYEKYINVLAEGFSKEDTIKLIEKAIMILKEKMNNELDKGKTGVQKAWWHKEKSAKLELIKEYYLSK